MSQDQPTEAGELHTRILQLALAVEESRAYWANVEPQLPAAKRNLIAFENRWFGAKSLERVRKLLSNFTARYDTFPDALSVLRRWKDMDPETRRAICHWHLQLSDPLYRRFSGKFLVERRESLRPTIDRPVVVRWVKEQNHVTWGSATCNQFGSKLLSAAKEAGLVSEKDPRTLPLPKVTDAALGYLLYLLRTVRFEGTLFENPYLASVGLTGAFLDQRLKRVGGVVRRRSAGLDEVEWAAPSLAAWAEGAVL